MGALRLNNDFLKLVPENLGANEKKCVSSYRFGFGGHEKDDEVYNVTGSWLSFGDYGYDSRLGRRPSPDPIVKPHESPYATFANNPIWFIDPTGLDTANYDMNSTEWESFDPDKDVVQIDEVSIKPEETKPLSSNPIYRTMQLKGIKSFGTGIKWGDGLTPEQQAKHDEWMGGLMTMVNGGLGLAFAPAIASFAGELALAESPIFSTKFWAVKSVFSIGGQALFNDGRVNTVGVATDAVTFPGFNGLIVSSASSSMFELNFNIYNGNVSSRSVFGSKPVSETAFQFGTSMVIGSKLKLINRNITGEIPKLMISAPNSFAVQGLNKVYDKK